jgi:uncharacterized protein YndB with AHSA1/START domain
MTNLASRSDIRSLLVQADAAAVFAAISDPARLARWWGPDGFTNTIHVFEFAEGGRWLLTMHGPDGRDYPNESRITRIVADRHFAIEHLGDHHFLLSLDLEPRGDATMVHWCQTFDTAEHFERVAPFVVPANQQNLHRLQAEAVRNRTAA